jgi:hypothetical protein
VLLLAATWGLWLWQLDASDLTFDESATYFVAHRPVGEIIPYLQGAVREHPPLYYLLVNGWMAVAGATEFSLRFLSVMIGMVAVALAGWVGRVSRTAAGAARGLPPALLLAIAPGMVFYARDARMYALAVVWAVLSSGLFLRDWLPENAWPRWPAVLALVSVHLLALFTHYYLLLLILVQPLVLLLTRRWRPLAIWAIVHGLPALAGLAWLQLAPGLRMTAAGIVQGTMLTIPSGFQVFRLLGKILFSPVVQVPFTLLYRLLALAGVGLLLLLWRRRALAAWAALAFLVPLALAFQVPQTPVARYLIFLLLPLSLALGELGAIPGTLRRRWLGRSLATGLTLGLAVLLAAGGLSQALAHDRSHYGDTLVTIKSHFRQDDAFIFYGPWQELLFNYYDPGGLPPPVRLPPYAPPQLDPDYAILTLQYLLAHYDRLWIVPAAVGDVDPDHFAAGWLNTHAHGVWRSGDFTLYVPPLPPDAPWREVDATFGDVLQLERVAWEPAPIRAGDPVRVTLTWRPLQRLNEDPRVALELVDGSGHVWDRNTAVPGMWAEPPSTWTPGQPVTDYAGLMVPLGAPPGEYTVRLLALGTETDLLTIDVVDTGGAPSSDLPSRVYLPYIVAGEGTTPAPEGTPFCAPSGAPCVSLIDHEPGGDRFRQGYPLPLALHWRSPLRPLPELSLRVAVVDRPGLPLSSGPVIVSQTLPLAPTYPTTEWSPNRLVSVPLALALPPEAPTGRAQVTLAVLGPDGTLWRTPQGRPALDLFRIRIEGRDVLRRLPWDLNRTRVSFGDAVELRGYQVNGEAQPGGELHLTYAWHARVQPPEIYAVFNHLVAADGTQVAQADGWPQEGRQLSTQWQPGDYIEDHYTIEIPADAPPGPYTLYTGLYEALTGDRLPAFRDGQRLPQDRVPIPLPGGDRP